MILPNALVPHAHKELVLYPILQIGMQILNTEKEPTTCFYYRPKFVRVT